MLAPIRRACLFIRPIAPKAQPLQLQRIHVRQYANIDRKNPTKKHYSYLDEDAQKLHRWIEDFLPTSVPKHLCKMTFSRSSGPGGQNVNKYCDQGIIADIG